MRIYIAGAWVEQYERSRPMIAAVKKAGIEITCDWTQAEGEAICAMCGCPKASHATGLNAPVAVGVCRAFTPVKGDSMLSPADRLRFAVADRDGVLTADLVWLLVPNDKGAAGSWVELGIAIGASAIRGTMVAGMEEVAPIVFVSGPRWKNSIFTEFAKEKFDTDAEALNAIVDLHEMMSGLRQTANLSAAK